MLTYCIVDPTLASLLVKYPELSERNMLEKDRLRHTANWMILAFYTIQARNNKSFLIYLIPRIVEGKNAKYVTGSGQTRATNDRVNIFRIEGNCEQIKRPPRKRKNAEGNYEDVSQDDNDDTKPPSYLKKAKKMEKYQANIPYMRPQQPQLGLTSLNFPTNSAFPPILIPTCKR